MERLAILDSDGREREVKGFQKGRKWFYPTGDPIEVGGVEVLQIKGYRDNPKDKPSSSEIFAVHSVIDHQARSYGGNRWTAKIRWSDGTDTFDWYPTKTAALEATRRRYPALLGPGKKQNPDGPLEWRGHRYYQPLGYPGFSKQVAAAADFLADDFEIEERSAGAIALNMANLEAGKKVDADEHGSRLEPEDLLRSINEKADGGRGLHGVEAMWVSDDGELHQRGYGDIVAEYVNTGDTYAATVIYDYEVDKFMITGWGDWVERWEKQRFELELENPTIYLDNLSTEHEEDGTILVTMRGRDACRIAKHHQSISGSRWECSDENFAYAIIVDEPGIVEKLESKGYDVNEDEYSEPDWG